MPLAGQVRATIDYGDYSIQLVDTAGRMRKRQLANYDDAEWAATCAWLTPAVDICLMARIAPAGSSPAVALACRPWATSTPLLLTLLCFCAGARWQPGRWHRARAACRCRTSWRCCWTPRSGLLCFCELLSSARSPAPPPDHVAPSNAGHKAWENACVLCQARTAGEMDCEPGLCRLPWSRVGPRVRRSAWRHPLPQRGAPWSSWPTRWTRCGLLSGRRFAATEYQSCLSSRARCAEGHLAVCLRPGCHTGGQTSQRRTRDGVSIGFCRWWTCCRRNLRSMCRRSPGCPSSASQQSQGTA